MTQAGLCRRSASEIRCRQPPGTAGVRADMRLQMRWSPELRPVPQIAACQRAILDSPPLNEA